MKRVKIVISVISMIMLLTLVSVAEPAVASSFQQIIGKLDGADFLIQIPNNWNGDLVVFCVGYSHLPQGAEVLLFYAYAFAPLTTDMGFAIAISNYGEGGYCIKEGVIRTHQLTEYVIGNYDVTGKVYLFGLSMGGCIALLLGAKYPNLYDGVLEAAGTKDAVSMYTLKMNYANIADDDDLEAAILANGGLVPPSPFTTVGEFRDYCLTAGNDLALACGGTPEKKPKAYERISPTFSAVDIEVPTITVHGDADALVPYADSLEYFTAVTQAGHSDLYRLYKVSGAQHIDPLLTIQMGMSFFYLVTWVEYGIPPPPSNT